MAQRILPIKGQIQKTAYWCWATIASMLSEALNHPADQCRIATAYLNNGNNCCANPALCLKSAELDAVLVSREYSLPDESIGGSVSFAIVKYDIDRNKPIGALITNEDDNFYHYVLIVGYSDDAMKQIVYYIDPRYGRVTQCAYDDLGTSVYSNDGTWSHTYYIIPIPISLG